MSIRASKISESVAIFLMVILTIPVVYLSLFAPFEADTGDSIMHYYYARYGFQYPAFFLDHWAKPVFTLLASPFARFGFGGIKLFNGMAGLLSAWITYCIARKLGLKFSWLAIVFVFFAPAYFVKLFSGYTEPLFGLILITSVCLVFRKQFLISALLLSFLPFVRSEGLIIMVVFALYFYLHKNYKAILLLSAGHVIYSFIGFFAGKSFLWIFTEIPYHLISAYGKGDFAHYPTQLLITLGVPLFMLSMVGIAAILLGIVSKKIQPIPTFKPEVLILIFGSFLAYFLFHIFSWGFGLFGSMGMSRVLVAMVPLLSVISLIGLNFLLSWKQKGKFPFQALIYIPIIGYILAFPFLHNPASIDFNKELRRSPEMELMNKIAVDVNKQYPDKFLYYSNPYLSYSLNINPFDTSKHRSFTNLNAEKGLHPNSLIIWDNWFSVVEERTDSLSLFQNPTLHLVNRYETEGTESKKIFLVFSN
jgi:hypothetical protein